MAREMLLTAETGKKGVWQIACKSERRMQIVIIV